MQKSKTLTLVAEEAAPSLLAVALPGLLARTMEAARVTDTVITVTTTESHAAPISHHESNAVSNKAKTIRV